jgi:isopenicillin-N N-acyltransferase-like protein
VRAAELPAPAPHSLTVISGTPRERGRHYGRAFKDGIRRFLEREIYDAFTKTAPTRTDVLRYAEACAREVRSYSPEVLEELEGMAEGSGLSLEETVLITLHEELWHKGVLPEVHKCTALAVGPPDTADGRTYVAQTWDWMPSVFGLSELLLWKRSEGPSVLAYAYPGLWAGAGVNSRGIALCWTSGDGRGIRGPRAGIPSYVLIAQMLYQKTLEDAVAEAKRARHAGWFTFVLADGEGRIANVEGTPEELAVEYGRGHMTRVLLGSRKLTRTPDGQPVKFHPRCARMQGLLGAARGSIDRAKLKGFLSDHADGNERVCLHPSTLDGMIYDCTRREAHLTRGPVCEGRWKSFNFDEPAGARSSR